MIGFVSLGSGEFVRRGFEGCCSIVLSRLLLTPCWCFCSLPCVDSSAPRSRLQRCWYQFKWVWLQLRASATNNRGHQVQIPKITANLWFKISYADLCHSGDSSSVKKWKRWSLWVTIVEWLEIVERRFKVWSKIDFSTYKLANNVHSHMPWLSVQCWNVLMVVKWVEQWKLSDCLMLDQDRDRAQQSKSHHSELE